MARPDRSPPQETPPILNIAKIIPPRFLHILPRPRLLKRLEHQQDKKLTLILAQAGQGKSTLAVSYTLASKTPYAWINLGPEDSEAVNLFHLLGYSLERALPALNFSGILACPSVAMGPREDIPQYRDWVLSLYRLISGPVRVVLDGLDRLPFGASAYRFLQVLLDEAPAHAQFLVLSREMPPLEIQTLLAGQEAYIFTNKDLAFTLGETTNYFEITRKLTLAPEVIKRIHRLTEGWIGGIVLFCDSLDWVPERQRDKYISEDLARKFIWGIFQFFGQRIFGALPREVQDFLVRSSILEVVQPSFVKESMGIANAQVILEDLAKRNLFVQTIYDKKKGWLYRYHQLFKDFLQTKFQAQLAKEQQVTSYRQAGSHAEQQNELEASVRYYLRAGAYPEAVAVMVRLGWDMVRMGKTAELSQWLSATPPDLLQANPWLLFYHYMTGRFTGSQEYILSLQKALGLFDQQEDFRGTLLCLAYLIEAAITRGHPGIDPIHILLVQAEQLVQSLSPGLYAFERAVLYYQMGFAHCLRSGNPRKGVWACQQAFNLARDLGDLPLQIGALTHGIGALSLLGEYSRAEEMVQRVEKLLGKCPLPDLQVLYLINASRLYGLQGDLPKMAALLQKAREQTENHDLTYLYPSIMLYEQVLQIHLGQYSEAEEIGRNLVSLTLATGNLFWQGNASYFLGISAYRREDFLRAREFLGQAREILSREEARADLHLSFIKTGLALVSMHLEGNGGGAQELQAALDHFTEISSYLFMNEAHLAMGLLKSRQGLEDEARFHLQTGMRIAQERGYWHNLLLSRQDLLKACLLALEWEIKEVWDFAGQLLAAKLAPLAGAELERLSRHANPGIARKAWEVRLAIRRAGLPRLRLQTLGGFRLWRGTTLVNEEEWEGRQPQLLLKTIVAHGPKEVPKDILIEDLWPDGSPEVTEKNFKVNLHRLRKFLEPDLERSFGSSYIHLKTNFIFLDQELCRVDVDEFLALAKEAAKKEGQGEMAEALACYRQALELYGGDFLAEEVYSPWAETKREELREKYLGILYRAAALHEKRGALMQAIEGYKKVTQTDPTAEPAHQKLMLLYAQRGLRNAALQVYRNLKKALKTELNAEPDEVTTAIYRKIAE
jgi:LuxR family maltose regulon positive regulatory protein